VGYHRAISAQSRLELAVFPLSGAQRNYEIRVRNEPGTTINVITRRDAQLNLFSHRIEQGNIEALLSKGRKLKLVLSGLEYQKATGCRPTRGNVQGTWKPSEGTRVGFPIGA
jgi:hypothetical protein